MNFLIIIFSLFFSLNSFGFGLQPYTAEFYADSNAAGVFDYIGVANDSAEKIFVQITLQSVLLVDNSLQFSPVDNPRTLPVLLLENTLKVPGRSNVKVPLRYKGKYTDSDQYFGIKISGINPRKKFVGKLAVGKSAMHGDVTVGYNALIIVRPKVLKPDYKIDRDGQSVVVTNLGNTQVRLIVTGNCTQNADSCPILAQRGVVVKQTVKFKLPDEFKDKSKKIKITGRAGKIEIEKNA